MAQTMTLKIDLRMICLALIVVIFGMLLAWKPWSGSQQRTIEITGQAEIEAVPDQFVFYPYFERKDADQAKAKAELDEFGNQLLEDLEALGVDSDDIKLSSSAYDYSFRESDDPTVNLQVTITVVSAELAQKVQDYLATTDAKGQLTPGADFSEAKRKELEAQVRQLAVDDAKQKASALAAQLEARVGKVISITDSQDFSPPWLYSTSAAGAAEDIARQSLPVKPGKQTLTLSVSVTFALR